jgi:hypothetical protein
VAAGGGRRAAYWANPRGKKGEECVVYIELDYVTEIICVLPGGDRVPIVYCARPLRIYGVGHDSNEAAFGRRER